MGPKNLTHIGSDKVFLTDGGLETFLIYKKNIDLPGFAAFTIVKDESGKEILRNYYRKYYEIAVKNNHGFLFESPTWRASPDWAKTLGLSNQELEDLIKTSVEIMLEIREEIRSKSDIPVILSGCLGPKGDGYKVGDIKLTPEEAQDYHSFHIGIFAQKTKVDLVTAFTLNYPEEAIGIVEAAKIFDIPVVISFTVETDGKLASGISLEEAVKTVDEATGNYPSYYMINCAHPDHFLNYFDKPCEENEWQRRFGGFRPNASKLSHEELDNLTSIDEGDPCEFGSLVAKMMTSHKGHLNVLGGCCGTGFEHTKEIAKHLKKSL